MPGVNTTLASHEASLTGPVARTVVIALPGASDAACKRSRQRTRTEMIG